MMDGESPESLRHTAAQDRKDEVGENKKQEEKKTLLVTSARQRGTAQPMKPPS